MDENRIMPGLTFTGQNNRAEKRLHAFKNTLNLGNRKHQTRATALSRFSDLENVWEISLVDKTGFDPSFILGFVQETPAGVFVYSLAGGREIKTENTLNHEGAEAQLKNVCEHLAENIYENGPEEHLIYLAELLEKDRWGDLDFYKWEDVSKMEYFGNPIDDHLYRFFERDFL